MSNGDSTGPTRIMNSILVVQLKRLGDVILTTPALNALRKLYPEARIEPSTGKALEYARKTATADETVLVCGSLYLVGEARAILLQ